MSVLDKIKQANTESRNPPSVDEVSRSELFNVFASMEQPSTVLEYKPTDNVSVELRFRVLTSSELQAAQIRAINYCKKKFGNTQIDDASLADAKAHEILAMSITEPKESIKRDGTKWYKPVFLNSDDIYNNFTASQVAKLFDCYLLTQKRFEPSADVLYMRDNFEDWCKALAGEVEKTENFCAALPWDVVLEICVTLIQIHGKSLFQAEKSLESSLYQNLTSVQDTLSSTTSVEDIVSEPSLTLNKIKTITKEEALEKAKSRKRR